MKTMTCNQLAGACDTELHADTFEEMVQLSQQHGMEMAQKNDEPHLKVMEEMKKSMGDPNAMQEMMDKTRETFDALPEDN